MKNIIKLSIAYALISGSGIYSQNNNESDIPHYFYCFGNPECAKTRLGLELLVAHVMYRVENSTHEQIPNPELQLAHKYLKGIGISNNPQMGIAQENYSRRTAFLTNFGEYLNEYYALYKDCPEKTDGLQLFLKRKFEELVVIQQEQ